MIAYFTRIDLGFIFGHHDAIGIPQMIQGATFSCNGTLTMAAAYEVVVVMTCRTTIGSWSELSSPNGARCTRIYPAFGWYYEVYTAYFDDRIRNCRTGEN